VALLSAAMAACGMPAFAEAPTADAKPSADVAWLVIGIQPADARMEIDEPLVKNGVAWSFHYKLNAYHPTDGFIVVKAEPGKAYGVAASSLMFGNSIFGKRYKPCGQVPLFQADAGKVVYITTITYRDEGATMNRFGVINLAEAATYSQDLDGARAFLKIHYPGLSDSVEQGGYQMTPVARGCG
jgi:hypothetical protein